MMMICSVNRVKKNIAGQMIFNDLSIEIREGERLAFVGPNGCGKTTLMKMIVGTENCDQGNIAIKRGARIGYLEQIPKFEEGRTVSECLKKAFQPLLELEVEMKKLEQQMATEGDPERLNKVIGHYGELQQHYEEQGGYLIEAKINQVAQGLGIIGHLELPFERLSGGEQTKVGLAALLLTNPDLLLLDEPTNHLDMEAIEWLEDWLVQSENTVVMTSHDRQFLDKVVTKIYDLDDEEALPYHGNYSDYIVEREKRLLLAFAHYEEQQKKIKKMKATIKRLKEWGNRAKPPNAKFHRQAKSMEKALEKMEKLDRPQLEEDKMALSFQAEGRSGKDVIKLENLSFAYDNRAPLFVGVNLHLRYQERAAIIGPNGAGKSTLLKLILGELQPTEGRMNRGTQLNIGYLSQKTFEGRQDQRLIEAFREHVPVSEAEARHLLAQFLFYGADVFKKVQDLSGGERMRLRLAQFMHQDINLLILDEPTNHLDIPAREALEDALSAFNGTVLAVSHDRWFLNHCFHKIYYLDNQTMISYPGNYDYVKEKRSDN
ncbi:ATPase subunit of ABC transporter with duplicated ATPase domains [Pullulanibacillus pueri]|uniref:ABC transporter ATP-binding protein n=1 Tax=Pullulanibacillus pueri TaxID=1437324 RepID=A0A8J2ZY96_9BACL|nr:ABC-F family ATP-binding cassette domain-containing protein [Pullulanibacillus pueri]MBM7680543.1 ATPase subunit of ABC transporter with duplicated ATPase domains [Pullulanibacillus pueri]GGH86172.1 ABC transporter ATP-binding protein [Pullulanibacillus pueri]